LSAIPRQAKAPPIDLIALAKAPSRGGRIARELAALAFAAAAAWAMLSLGSREFGGGVNLGGSLGGALATALTAAFGVEAYLVIVAAAALGWRAWTAENWRTVAYQAVGAALLLIAISAIGGAIDRADAPIAGTAGTFITTELKNYLNFGGGAIAVMVAIAVGLALTLQLAPTDFLATLASRRRADSSDPPTDAAAAPVVSTNAAGGPSIRATISAPTPSENFAAEPLKLKFLTRLAPKSVSSKTASLSGATTSVAPPRGAGGFQLPPLDLLDTPSGEHAAIDEAALGDSARAVEQKLGDFGVAGRVVEVQPGPVVTMYKFEPGSGVKVSQIVNLADDLSLALRAPTVRIQAPVPGEAVVGIEVPNRRREKVYLREILEAEEFRAAQSQLTIALGKDIAGHPAAADLATMPHLLIAGATGTGKSVSIHTMIASILFNATADDVRFILIDPKMLELSVYDAIPHLLVPVVVDPEKAAAALLWATQEMESRYRLMRDLGVRNIDGYNRVIGQGGELVELRRGGREQNSGADEDWQDESIKYRSLPKIVIVIDELADLLLSEGKTVERDITRLAQKARAAGIHLILATQRPSVDVLTGLIKANLPARISLQVTSRVDSRTILDSIGAERLLGAGDMLFMPPGTAKLRRLHGPFVSETEIRKVCDFLRAQGAPDYRMEILETAVAGDGDGPGGADDYRDDLYDDAVRIVLDTNQASISMIQRRLRIGYNRAARMVERMEREGLVMPADGARPREVRMRSPE
jgi:S-DNA-T family DNA segregation ATPase FtsK/SpoIIIE